MFWVSFPAKCQILQNTSIILRHHPLSDMRLPHFTVERAAFKQFFMLALYFDMTILHHGDPIRTRNGGQPAGDYNNRFVFDQLCRRFLNDCFVFGVDIRRRRIQNDDWDVFQHGTGDGNPLPFTAGKMGAASADYRIKSIFQVVDKAASIVRRCFYLGIACVSSPMRIFSRTVSSNK